MGSSEYPINYPIKEVKLPLYNVLVMLLKTYRHPNTCTPHLLKCPPEILTTVEDVAGPQVGFGGKAELLAEDAVEKGAVTEGIREEGLGVSAG
jgi:hypothetical protein